MTKDCHLRRSCRPDIIKYLVRVFSLIGNVRHCGNKACGEAKVTALLLTVEVAADLGRVIVAVGVLAGCFDEDLVEVFHGVR